MASVQSGPNKKKAVAAALDFCFHLQPSGQSIFEKSSLSQPSTDEVHDAPLRKRVRLIRSGASLPSLPQWKQAGPFRRNAVLFVVTPSARTNACSLSHQNAPRALKLLHHSPHLP